MRRVLQAGASVHVADDDRPGASGVSLDPGDVVQIDPRSIGGAEVDNDFGAPEAVQVGHRDALRCDRVQLPPRARIVPNPDAQRRPEIDHELVASCIVKIPGRKMGSVRSVNLVPGRAVVKIPDSETSEVDDEIVLSIAVEITGNHQVRVERVQLLPIGPVDKNPDPLAREIDDDLVASLSVQVCGDDTARMLRMEPLPIPAVGPDVDAESGKVENHLGLPVAVEISSSHHGRTLLMQLRPVRVVDPGPNTVLRPEVQDDFVLP